MSNTGSAAVLDCHSLPSSVAIPVHDYLSEADPFVKLWCLCDVVEITLRLVVAAGVAELRHGGRELPDSLRRELGELVDRPTLGQWRFIAATIATHLPCEADLAQDIISLLHTPIHGLCSLLNSPSKENRSAANSILLLRNDLAHGGASSKRLAAKYLALWQPRFEAAMAHHQAILRDWRLIVATPTGFAELKGFDKAPCRADLPDNVAAGVRTAAANAAQECVVLVRSSAVRALWPLTLFGIPVVDSVIDTPPAAPAALQLYRRREASLHYTPIGSDDTWASVGKADTHAAFSQLFKLPPTQTRYCVRGFERDIARDASAFVGRRNELHRIRQLLAERSTGVLWLTGPAGIGKSFLFAKVVVEMMTPGETGPQPVGALALDPKILMLAYRFNEADDRRCSTRSFCRFALERLAEWGGVRDAPSEKADPDANVSTVELRCLLREMLIHVDVENGYRVIFAIDGIDELLEKEHPRHRETATSTSTFVRELPVACGELSGVLWLCAGRPEAALQRSFDAPVCFPVFGDDQHALPPMLSDDVREMLVSELEGPARRRLLGRDADLSDTARLANDFIDAVTTNSQGLPLYVRLVLGEAKQRSTLRDFDPSVLPATLEEFYGRLSRRFSLGGLQQYTPRVMAALAIAKEPLSAETLLAILRAGNTFGPPATPEIASRQKVTLSQVLSVVSTLVEYESTPDDETGYSLAHLSLREFLTDESRCPDMEEALATARIAIARYCCDRSLLQGPARTYIIRNAIHHLIDLKLWSELESLAMDPCFLEAKVASGWLHELIDDLQRVTAVLPADRSMRGVVEWIMKGVRRHTGFIERHAAVYPQALFQCLWNECTDVASRSDPLSQHVASLLAHWRDEKARTGTPWLRKILPSGDAAHSSELACLEVSDRGVMCVATCPESRRLALGCGDGSICVIDAITNKQIARLAGHRSSVCGITILADGRIVSASDDGTVRIWTITADAEEKTLVERDNEANAVAVSRDGSRLVIGWEDGSVWMWDVDSQTPPRLVYQHGARITAVTLTADGDRVAFTSQLGGGVVASQSGRVISRMRGHSFTVTCVAFSPDGTRVASGARDGTARVWDVESGTEVGCFSGHTSWVRCVAFSPDGGLVASATGRVLDNRGRCDVRIWTVASQAEVGRYIGHDGPVTGVCWGHDGRWIASCSYDGTVRLWDARKFERATVAQTHAWSLPRMPFSPGGTLLALIPRDDSVMESERRLIQVFHTDSGRCVATLTGHLNAVTSVAFAPDGNVIASGSFDRSVRIWDLDTAKERMQLTGHQDHVYSVAFSHQGTLLASGSGGRRDDTVRIWETATGREVGHFPGHEDTVTALAFSPNGKLIMTAAGDFLFSLNPVQAVIRVWDVLTGIEVGRLNREIPVWDVAFSEDGNSIAFASLDQSVERWDIRLTTSMCRTDRTFDFQRVFTTSAMHPRFAVESHGRDCVVESLDDRNYRAWFSLLGPAVVAMNPDGRSFAYQTDSGVVGLVCLE